MTDVLIVGAGPAGLSHLNPRSLDLLARRGLADPLIDEGWQVPQAAFSGLPVTLSLAGARTDHPYSLGIPQTRVEEVLEARAIAIGADVRRGHEFRDLRQDPSSVAATVADPVSGREYRISAHYLVGCDGGRSTVRRLAGIDFPGTAATRFSLLGDVELDGQGTLPFGVSHGPGGRVIAIPRPGYTRVITADRRPSAARRPGRCGHAGDAPVRRRRGARPSRRAARRPVADPVRQRRPAGGRVRPRPGHPGRRRRPHPPACRGDMYQTAGHPWLGRLAPNIALTTAAGDTDLATQLTRAAGRPLLLDLAATKPKADSGDPIDGLRQALTHWHGPAAQTTSDRV